MQGIEYKGKRVFHSKELFKKMSWNLPEKKKVGKPKGFKESPIVQYNKEELPNIYSMLLAYQYGEEDITEFLDSQLGRHLANRIQGILLEPLSSKENKQANIKRTIRNSYINFRQRKQKEKMKQ